MLKALLILLSLALSFSGHTQWQVENEQILWSASAKEKIQRSQNLAHQLNARLKRQQIQGVELIVAREGDQQIQSQFGHAMILFKGTGAQAGLDLVLNFVAYIDTQQISAIGGLTGRYALIPELQTLNQTLLKYHRDQDRPLIRNIIPLHNDQIKRLIETVQSYWDEIALNFETSLEQSRAQAGQEARAQAQAEGLSQVRLLPLDHPQGGILGMTWLPQELAPQALPDHHPQVKQALYSWWYLRQLQFLSNERLGQDIYQLGQSFLGFTLPKQSLVLDFDPERTQLSELQQKALDYFDLPLQQLVVLSRPDPRHSLGRPNAFVFIPRNIWEEVITQQQIKLDLISPRFIALKTPKLHHQDLGRYTFLGNNCAEALVAFLARAGLPTKPGTLINRRIPMMLHEYTTSSLLTPYPSLTLDFAIASKEKIVNAMGPLEQLSQKEWTEMQKKAALALSPIEQQLLLYFAGELRQQTQRWVEDHISSLYLEFYELINFRQLPATLYGLCQSKACAEDVLRELPKHFSKQDIESGRQVIHQATRLQLRPGDYRRTDRNRQHSPSPQYYRSKEVLEHLYLLGYIPASFLR